MSTWTEAEDRAFRATAGGEPGENGHRPTSSENPAAAALIASRIDLIELLRSGIPEPTHVPGGEPWLRRGKRYLVPASAGTGKSLGMLVVAVTVVEAGGTVVILDVENGADEYARRLEDILRARDLDGSLADACQQRLRYHDWPRFSLAWTPEAWAHAIDGADLVIFDSSRLSLSSVGLAEDSNDDYSGFLTGLVVPLARAGSTTIILDNTGHTGTHARGASSKADLNEVIYNLKAGAAFDRDQAGYVRLVLSRTRFSGLPRELRINLGAGTYSAPVAVEADGTDPARWRPTHLMQKASLAIEATPGLSQRAILADVGGSHEYTVLALELLVAEGYVRREQGPRRSSLHYSEKPFRELYDPSAPVHPDCASTAPRSTETSAPECPPPLRGALGRRTRRGAVLRPGADLLEHELTDTEVERLQALADLPATPTPPAKGTT